jgi:DNA gyrase/topoisomerase IV subunit A
LLYFDLIIVTASGMINRFAASLITQGRNKAGSNLIKLKKNDYIVGVCTYDPNESEITIISTYKERGSDKLLSQCILMSSIPVLSTISAGTKMLNSGIVNICCTM